MDSFFSLFAFLFHKVVFTLIAITVLVLVLGDMVLTASLVLMQFGRNCDYCATTCVNDCSALS